MLIEPDGHRYPSQRIRVHPFNPQFDSLFTVPPGQIGTDWPPLQMTYMGIYLDSLGCRTIVHERHYIDRHYIDDFSLFYSRSLRDYPNHCQRLHARLPLDLSSTIPTRITLLRNSGANSAQSARRARSLQMSNTDGWYYEYSVEANVRPASSSRNATMKSGWIRRDFQPCTKSSLRSFRYQRPGAPADLGRLRPCSRTG